MVNKKKICFKKEGEVYLVSKMSKAFRLVHYISKEVAIEANRRFPRKPPIVHDVNSVQDLDFLIKFNVF